MTLLTRAFLDSGVLLAANRAEEPLRFAARRLLRDPRYTFLTSPFVYLEVVPKARFFQRLLEREIYEIFFQQAHWQRDTQQIVTRGLAVAEQFGLGAMDALHVAAAQLLGADAVITVEKPGRAIYRAGQPRVIYLGDLD